jgi:hypothetical protein
MKVSSPEWSTNRTPRRIPSLVYHPTVVGEEFLKKIGAVVYLA